MPHSSTIVLTLDSAQELFVGPPPGGRRALLPPRGPDDTGAVLGKPGVDRLVRMLASHRTATRLTIRIPHSEPAEAVSAIIPRLRHWCAARAQSNQENVRRLRRLGAQGLLVCMVLLAFALVIAWAIQNPAWLGRPGPVRTLIGEAIIIAGWVVLWRPIELLLFDTVRPRLENRVLDRARLLDVSTERYDAAQPQPAPDVGEITHPPLN